MIGELFEKYHSKLLNKLLKKYAPHPLAEMLKEEKTYGSCKIALLRKGIDNYLIAFPGWLRNRASYNLLRIVVKTFSKLTRIRKTTERTKAFTNLRPWLRRFLIMKYESELFPNNWRNRKFIEEQIADSKMKRVQIRPSLMVLEW